MLLEIINKYLIKTTGVALSYLNLHVFKNDLVLIFRFIFTAASFLYPLSFIISL